VCTRPIAIACIAAAFLAAATFAQPLRADPGELTLEPATVRAGDGTEIRAEFGVLTVPENRLNPDSRAIQVRFCRLFSEAADPAPPLIDLAGGPGGTSVWRASNPDALTPWLPFLEAGDVIFFDQRGTGAGAMALRHRVHEMPPSDVFESAQNARAWMLRLHREGAEAVRARGVDLAGYTTVQSADDINDLRIALGLEKVRLLGFSYGTHLALATIRRHGAHIDSAVLCGVEGPDQTYKLPEYADTHLRRLSVLIAQDPVVGPEMPDFWGELQRICAELDENPLPVTIPGPTGEPVTLTLGGWGLRFLLRFDMGDARDLTVFPRLVRSVGERDPSVAAWFLQKRAPMLLGMNAMAVVMDTASGASPERMAMVQRQSETAFMGDVVNLFDETVLEIWGTPDLGDDYRAPVVSSVRTLFLAGSLDWNTPPFQAEQARWGFPNSALIRVENAGHEQILPNPAVHEAIARFLKGEDVSGVVASNPPLRFVPLEGYDAAVTHPSVERP
jgi:pimeloyl-ACP methyl ester carboxylesterase